VDEDRRRPRDLASSLEAVFLATRLRRRVTARVINDSPGAA